MIGADGAVLGVTRALGLLELDPSARFQVLVALLDQPRPVLDGGGEVALMDVVEWPVISPLGLDIVDEELYVLGDPGYVSAEGYLTAT